MKTLVASMAFHTGSKQPAGAGFSVGAGRRGAGTFSAGRGRPAGCETACPRGRAMRGVTPALSACRRPLHRRLPGEWQAYCVTAAIARNARARDRRRTPAPENPENINLRQSPKQRRARDLDAVVPARGRERLRRLEGRRARPMRPGIALPPDQRHALTEWPVPVGCCLTFSSITAIDP